jgi:hypothetical protein
MRWILLLIALFCFALVFAAKSPGLLALGLLLGFACLFGSLFGFAAERVAATARPDVAMLTDKDITALRASIRKPGTESTSNLSSAKGG